MARWGAHGAALVLAIATTACGSGGGAAAPTTSRPDGATADVTTTTLDGSRFCVAIRALEVLGTAPATSGGTPAQVLDQNSQLAGLITEATQDLPADAPDDVTSLLDDYRALSEAVATAAGDRDAALAGLAADDPGLIERLSDANRHRASFAYFAARCGTAPPP